MTAQELKQFRQDIQLTQKELAQCLGLTNVHICRLERGKAKISILLELALTGLALNIAQERAYAKIST